jgi:hypothetical protein
MLVDRDDEPGKLLLADMIRPALGDLDAYLTELDTMADRLRRCAGPIREKLAVEGRLFRMENHSCEGELQAVDGAVVPLDRSALCTLIGLAVRVGHGQQLGQENARISGENSQGFRQLSSALRLQLELRLLRTAETVTILDNSFWSLLWDCSQIVTRWKEASGTVKSHYDAVAAECFSHSGTFPGTVENGNIVGISKTATSEHASAEFGVNPPIPDRILFTEVLREGEYMRPRDLTSATGGKFGIEHAIEHGESIKEVYKGEEIQVTFFRPWVFQKAYRIEYHKSRFPNRVALEGLLALVKRETAYRGIMEPRNQFMADKLCKQVREMSRMYDLAAVMKHPSLAGPYRTST